MKSLILLAVLFTITMGAPHRDENAKILKLENKVVPDGYDLEVETSNGISRHEQGKVADIGFKYPPVIVHGSYSWTDEADGKVYTVNYVADEFGYHPVGEHLPDLPYNSY